MRTPSGRLRCALALGLALGGACGRHEPAGSPTPGTIPPATRAQRTTAEARAAAVIFGASAPPPRQILFGDLHVHTTFSADAFQRSLPMLQGEGAHPPADACDFARFCSGLDFWSINDHAESLTPRHWQETKEALRQCDARAGDPANPDIVAFLGWEWTQEGAIPAQHFGHRNVVLRDLAEGRLPPRPIAARAAAPDGLGRMLARQGARLEFARHDFPHRQRYFDWLTLLGEISDVASCPADMDSRRLPDDCREVATTPRDLFDRLAAWASPALVIPHGTTWGRNTPPGWTFEHALVAQQHDERWQPLFEVYSGHGSAEGYRPWQAVGRSADGEPVCPAPSAGYEPCCWRAGELIRARCAEPDAAACEERVREARRLHAAAGRQAHLTVPGATTEEWLDCGQCRDCFAPAAGYQPGGAAQYALVRTVPGTDGRPRHARFGFVASSDTHRARPGTGYKEFARLAMTDATGARDAAWRAWLFGPEPARTPEAAPLEEARRDLTRFRRDRDFERGASFFYTGGLVAVHADGRSRAAIWDALVRREVYATSGERILLWFDLLNAPDGPRPMGAVVPLADVPRFRVRAIGAPHQRPGCPEFVERALSPVRVASLCRNECYHPDDRRRSITRIEVVRLRPQRSPDEPLAPLIEDPWRTLACPPDPVGCALEFVDPDFPAGGREVAYYVRAIQEPSPAINAGGLRCERDATGACVRVRPCYGDYRTSRDDDCLEPAEERAWSSPIWIEPR